MKHSKSNGGAGGAYNSSIKGTMQLSMADMHTYPSKAEIKRSQHYVNITMDMMEAFSNCSLLILPLTEAVSITYTFSK